ncbi:MAG: hypothetical protein IPN65_04365 [Elusimicrobia bacterium]|nr:hypothetical protein [Elusimicrobiota bacterium]
MDVSQSRILSCDECRGVVGISATKSFQLLHRNQANNTAADGFDGHPEIYTYIKKKFPHWGGEGLGYVLFFKNI